MRKHSAILLMMSAVMLAGCTSQLSIDADPAVIPAAVAAEQGYEQDGSGTVVREYQDRFTDVTLTSPRTVYTNNVSDSIPIRTAAGKAVYATIATSANLTDHSWLGDRNPLLEQPFATAQRSLAGTINRTINVRDRVATFTIQHNRSGATIDVQKHRITIDLDDYLNMDGYMLTGTIPVNGTVVLAHGAYPGWVDAQAEESILAMIEQTHINATEE